jgi:hypothetical protein
MSLSKTNMPGSNHIIQQTKQNKTKQNKTTYKNKDAPRTTHSVGCTKSLVQQTSRTNPCAIASMDQFWFAIFNA